MSESRCACSLRKDKCKICMRVRMTHSFARKGEGSLRIQITNVRMSSARTPCGSSAIQRPSRSFGTFCLTMYSVHAPRASGGASSSSSTTTAHKRRKLCTTSGSSGRQCRLGDERCASMVCHSCWHLARRNAAACSASGDARLMNRTHAGLVPEISEWNYVK